MPGRWRRCSAWRRRSCRPPRSTRAPGRRPSPAGCRRCPGRPRGGRRCRTLSPTRPTPRTMRHESVWQRRLDNAWRRPSGPSQSRDRARPANTAGWPRYVRQDYRLHLHQSAASVLLARWTGQSLVDTNALAPRRTTAGFVVARPAPELPSPSPSPTSGRSPAAYVDRTSETVADGRQIIIHVLFGHGTQDNVERGQRTRPSAGRPHRRPAPGATTVSPGSCARLVGGNRHAS